MEKRQQQEQDRVSSLLHTYQLDSLAYAAHVMDQGVAQADEGVSQPGKVSTTRTQDSSLQ